MSHSFLILILWAVIAVLEILINIKSLQNFVICIFFRVFVEIEEVIWVEFFFAKFSGNLIDLLIIELLNILKGQIVPKQNALDFGLFGRFFLFHFDLLLNLFLLLSFFPLLFLGLLNGMFLLLFDPSDEFLLISYGSIILWITQERLYILIFDFNIDVLELSIDLLR